MALQSIKGAMQSIKLNSDGSEGLQNVLNVSEVNK